MNFLKIKGAKDLMIKTGLNSENALKLVEAELKKLGN